MTGVSLVVLVTEPTVAGVHDLRRVAELAEHFGLPAGMVINKSSINPEGAEELRRFAGERKIRYLGEIPYDRRVVETVADLEPYPCAHDDDEIAGRLRGVWEQIRATAAVYGPR
jgi:MinD superfamily P-loop ATPase